MIRNIILIYLILINIITLILYGVDKQKAKKNRWRISEATLLTAAFIGGSLGALAGMHLFHHKTRKTAFRVGVPLMLMLHVVLLIVIVVKI